MSRDECFREPDIVDAVRSSEWPAGVAPALRAHVESCPVCAEVLAVALSFQTDGEEAATAVHLPTAAHVWWRAQIRARQDAAQAVARPMTIVESVAAASGVGLAAAAIAMGWSAVSSEWQEVATLPVTALAIGSAVAMLVFVPVAVYFALSEK